MKICVDEAQPTSKTNSRLPAATKPAGLERCRISYTLAMLAFNAEVPFKNPDELTSIKSGLLAAGIPAQRSA